MASDLLDFAPEAVLTLLEGASCIHEGLLIRFELRELRTGVEQQHLLEVGGLGAPRIFRRRPVVLPDG
ncbi:MAG TPA: hypothetical protein VI197_34820 [Polyangiaceae bacterium]